MPPLHQWLIGFSLVSVPGYMWYHHAYLPRVNLQEPIERHWEQERCKIQEVWKKLISLESMAMKIDQRQNTTENVPALTPSALLRQKNQKKLSFFYELQKARCSLLDALTSSSHLLARSVSFSEAVNYLKRLQQLQAKICAPLDFRLAPLTLVQKVSYLCALFLYLFTFKIIPNVIPSLFLDVDFFHLVSKAILVALDIPCSMTIAEIKDECEPLLHDDAPFSEEQAKEGEVHRLYRAQYAVRECSSSCKVVLPVQHWIEVVGFWACDNNPLLRCGLDFTTVWNMVVTQPTLSCQQWWEERFSSISPVLSIQRTLKETSCVGYPVVINCKKDTSQSPVILVTPTGLPFLLYGVKNGHSGDLEKDVLTKKGRRTAYEKVVEQQYLTNENDAKVTNSKTVGMQKKNENSKVNDKNQKTALQAHSNDSEKSDVRSLLYISSSHPRVRDALAMYLPFVYGDASRSHYKATKEIGLHFYFGKPCSSGEDAVKEAFDAW